MTCEHFQRTHVIGTPPTYTRAHNCSSSIYTNGKLGRLFFSQSSISLVLLLLSRSCSRFFYSLLKSFAHEIWNAHILFCGSKPVVISILRRITTPHNFFFFYTLIYEFFVEITWYNTDFFYFFWLILMCSEQMNRFQNQHIDNDSRISQTSKPIWMDTIQNNKILYKILYRFDNLKKFGWLKNWIKYRIYAVEQ